MHSIDRFSSGTPLAGLARADVGAPNLTPGGQPRPLSGESRSGLGGLEGRQIRVGNGQARAEANVHAERAKSFFKTTGKVLAGIVLSPLVVAGAGLAMAAGGVLLATRALLQIPRLVNEKILEPRADKRFELAHQSVLSKLRDPAADSIVRNTDVMDRLAAHAKAQGTPLDAAQLRDLVATGEQIARGLTAGSTAHDGMADISHELLDDADRPVGSGSGPAQDPSGSPVTLRLGSEAVQVSSSVHTTRALGWYMMAAAAQQDVQRELSGGQSEVGGKPVSDMTTSGSFVMKDPGNAIFKFLAAAPTADSRMSTHFRERVGHGEQHRIAGLIPSGKPSQRGIEDYRNMLPGQGGTMLFDKLAAKDGSQDLFVKFESVGCPPYFRREPHQGVGQGIARFFAAADRNIGHATNFAGSMMQGKTGANVVQRQEHVYKGVLKTEVHQPFSALVDAAFKAGVIDDSSKAVGKAVHKFGLPFIESALDQIQDAATQQDNRAVLRQVMDVRERLASASARLGQQSDIHGVERRGAEVHISLNPSDNRGQSLAGRLTPEASRRFEAETTTLSNGRSVLAVGPSGVCQQAEMDWPRADVTVGGIRMDHSPDSAHTAALLLNLAGGDTQLAMLVSQYANQSVLGPLMDALNRGDLQARLPDGTAGVPLGPAALSYSISRTDEGNIQLEVRYTRPQVDQLQTLDATNGAQVVPTDPARSHADFAFSLSINTDYSVRLADPLRFEMQVRPA